MRRACRRVVARLTKIAAGDRREHDNVPTARPVKDGSSPSTFATHSFSDKFFGVSVFCTVGRQMTASPDRVSAGDFGAEQEYQR